MADYDTKFYLGQMYQSSRSAEKIVPLVLDLFDIKSVCDVGCGIGTWLEEFKRRGVADIVGIDGEYVKRDMLRISHDEYLSFNLENAIGLDRQFDLVMSLEVAEHLPPSRSDSFVFDLVKLAPLVLFSAAVPRQGGTNHINEQYLSWWAQKFAGHGYLPVDILRPRIWDLADIAPHYRQNIIVFVREDIAQSSCKIIPSRCGQLDIIHPDIYEKMVPPDDFYLLSKHIWWFLHRKFRSFFWWR